VESNYVVSHLASFRVTDFCPQKSYIKAYNLSKTSNNNLKSMCTHMLSAVPEGYIIQNIKTLPAGLSETPVSSFLEPCTLLS
jgi:hypothetical protein